MRIDVDRVVVSAQGENSEDNAWYGLQIKGLTAPGDAAGWYDFQPAFGFASRPLDADIGTDGEVNGCYAFICDKGNAGGFAFLGHDPRATAKCPPVTKGSATAWNARGAFDMLDYDTNTQTLYVPVEFDSEGTPTKAHMMQVGFDANSKKVIDIRHCDGMAIVMLENSVVVKNAAGDAYIELNADGIVLNGNTKMVGGVDIGGGTALPLTLAPALASYLSALETLLTGLATAIDAKLVSTPGASVGAVTAFMAAGAAFKTAMTATLAKGL